MKKFKINGDTMTTLVVVSICFCAAVDIVAIIFAWFGKDIAAIVGYNHTLFGTELGICGLMTIFKRWADAKDKKKGVKHDDISG